MALIQSIGLINGSAGKEPEQPATPQATIYHRQSRVYGMTAEKKIAAKLTGDEVRAARTRLGMSASQAASLVGLSEGAAWRQWERNGVSGPGAVLVKALIDSPAVRRYFDIQKSPAKTDEGIDRSSKSPVNGHHRK